MTENTHEIERVAEEMFKLRHPYKDWIDQIRCVERKNSNANTPVAADCATKEEREHFRTLARAHLADDA